MVNWRAIQLPVFWGSEYLLLSTLLFTENICKIYTKCLPSDNDVIFQKEEYTVYYYGNDPVIDLTQDDAASPASPDITHISETE